MLTLLTPKGPTVRYVKFLETGLVSVETKRLPQLDITNLFLYVPTYLGYEDLKGTAKTYQRYYGDILTKNYNNSYYKFRHTNTQRTTESFKAFVEGLFGQNNNIQPEPIPEQDLLLRPYDYCESWRAHDYSSESNKFKHSAIWNKTIADISKRLGFQYSLESIDVELMWDMCRYEQAWHVDRTSVWCSVSKI
ncbi:multiple inositol polyphosphate phosphatase 1-like [Rhagoletis pomonella]|uniref:multiple inositol polyphosphate phosphatase 1-like n=1 Tax=Rhagoletis pomonella TaxID=28610 RepID=UPI00178275DC|nr:multiple inositol polyphosphate phosphatase 1-like [Rhagoletis pomonella]